MAISRYDPFREALSLRQAMDQLFTQSFVPSSWVRSPQAAFAAMDVYETDQGYQVSVALPGVKPEDIEVTTQQNTLVIRGQRRPTIPREMGQSQGQATSEKRQGNWLMQEIGTEAFERSMTFSRPIDSDHVQSEYENGILTLWLPVSESSRPRRIAVRGSQSQQTITS